MSSVTDPILVAGQLRAGTSVLVQHLAFLNICILCDRVTIGMCVDGSRYRSAGPVIAG